MAKSRVRLFNRSPKPGTSEAAAAPDQVVAKDRSTFYNQLSQLFLFVGTPLVLVLYLLIFFLPQLPINPFQPVALSTPLVLPPTAVITPTLTSTPTRTPYPTNTVTPTPLPTDAPTLEPTLAPTVEAVLTITLKPPTATPRGARTATPTATPKATVTPTPVIGTPTPTRSPFNYTAKLIYQKAQVVYTVNWQGIAGVVLDAQFKHQPNILVHAWGDPPLGDAGQDVVSGTFDRYGPSGFEFTLGDKLSIGTWHVELIDAGGQPISEVVDVVMQGDPRANLAFITFQQNH